MTAVLTGDENAMGLKAILGNLRHGCGKKCLIAPDAVVAKGGHVVLLLCRDSNGLREPRELFWFSARPLVPPGLPYGGRGLSGRA